MKEFIGKKVEFVVDGFPAPFHATVVGDNKQFVLVKGEGDEFSRRLVKSKIVSFMPLEKVGADVNLLVLACENPTIGCPGVQFIKEGEGFSQNDFRVFMSPCPSLCKSCRKGSLGELRSLDGYRLGDMFSGTMFGDYPEQKLKASDDGESPVS
jgi:hypothetical protein